MMVFMVGTSREHLIADRALRDQLDAVALAELGRPRIRAVPARWKVDPTWRCINHHVSKAFERDWQDRRVCSVDGCRAPVQLTFPEDRAGPLWSEAPPPLPIPRILGGASPSGTVTE